MNAIPVCIENLMKPTDIGIIRTILILAMIKINLQMANGTVSPDAPV